MTSNCVGFSRCRIQFTRKGEQRAERDYSDRSVVELRQYDFANFSIRALDIENNREEIFAIPLQRENQYRRGKSTTVPDEIEGPAGTYCLWLNADSRTPFHDLLNAAIEEIKLVDVGPSETPDSSYANSSTANRYDDQDSFESRDRKNRNAASYTRGDDRDSPGSSRRHDSDIKGSSSGYDRERSKSNNRSDQVTFRSTYPANQDSLRTSTRHDQYSSRSGDRDPPGSSLRKDSDVSRSTHRYDEDSSRSTYRAKEDAVRSSTRYDQEPHGSTKRYDDDGARSKNEYNRDSQKSNRRDDRDNEDENTAIGSSSRNKPAPPKSKGQSNQNDILVDVYQLGQHITEGKTDQAVNLAKKLSQERVQLQANITDRAVKEESISIKIKIDSNSAKISNKYEEQIMNVYPSTTIAQLRAAFEHTQKFPLDNQCFFVNGHLAHEKSTMNDLAVHDDTLFVLFVID